MKLSFGLAGMAVAALLAAAPAAAQERVSIGTGGTGGLFYIIGAGMAEVLNRNMESTTARAEVTGASVENIRRVAAGQMTFGFSSASTLYEATRGEGPFEEALPVSGMAYLYPAVLQIATIEGTGIETMEDLTGKRINLGPPGSNSAVLVMRLLEAYGIEDEVNAQFLSYNEGTAAILNGTIDAAVVLAGAPTAALLDLGAQRDMRLLSVDGDVVAGVLDEFPFLQLYDIEPGTYEGQADAVTVINDPATLFVAEDTPEELVYNLTKALFDNLSELAEVHPQAAAIAVETGPDLPVDLHPGAARYFDEAGQ